MGLSSDLIKKFVKATNGGRSTRSTGANLRGTIVEYNGEKYVRLDGSELLTPISSTVNANDGERVEVRIENHTATVTGNTSSPAARGGDVDDLKDQITEFEVVIAGKVSTDELEAVYATIETLVAEDVKINGRLEATEASIDNLEADNVVINEKLTAAKAEIDELSVNKLDASVADIKYATIEDLEATNIDVRNLEADYGSFKDLSTDKFTAIEADIQDLDTKKLSAEQADLMYANIDFTNITQAAVEALFAKSGIIQDLVVGDGIVTGMLVGVTIKGDLIEGGTVVADKLVIKGEDGLYYKLNTNGETISTQQTEYNSLSGTIITAKSVTAEKIAVEDLVAFGATIGGFHITDTSLYSGVKESATNTTRGVYMDSTGQFSVGDSNNYLRFFRDSTGAYKLEFSAVDKMQIGGRNLLLGTGTGIGWTSSSFDLTTRTFTVQNDGTDSQRISNDESPVVLGLGRTYTISFDMYRDNSFRAVELRAVKQDGTLIFRVPTILESVGEYVRFKHTFDIPGTYMTDSDPIIFRILLNGGTGEMTTLSVKDIKLELGTQATDWTPAQEDIDDKIEAGDETVLEEMRTQKTEILTAVNSILLSALEEYVRTTDHEEFRETVMAQLEILAGQIEMNFTTTTERIENVDGDLQTKFNEIYKYITFSTDGITIGDGHSGITLSIDNEKGIVFSKNGVMFGHWDGVDFYTGNIVVQLHERAQFGNFAYVPRTDGSLSFLKVGDS